MKQYNHPCYCHRWQGLRTAKWPAQWKAPRGLPPRKDREILIFLFEFHIVTGEILQDIPNLQYPAKKYFTSSHPHPDILCWHSLWHYIWHRLCLRTQVYWIYLDFHLRFLPASEAGILKIAEFSSPFLYGFSMLSKGRYIEYMNIAGFSSSFLWLFNLTSYLAFCLALILTFYLTFFLTYFDILSDLTYIVTFVLTFFWPPVWHMFWHGSLSGLLSDKCSGPSVLSSRCGSGPGSAHCIQSWQRRRDTLTSQVGKNKTRNYQQK